MFKSSITLILFFLVIKHTLCGQSKVVFQRFDNNPIIKPSMLSEKDGGNIASPTLIKVPDWVHKKLGKYYLYFAHDNGNYIRLAYANDLKGPWKIHEGGALRLEECICRNNKSTASSEINHIASPDVHIDPIKKEIIMYYHCPLENKGTFFEKNFTQFTLRASSKDGVVFKSDTVKISDAYFRLFNWKGKYYGITQGGNLFRSSNPKGKFEPGPNLFAKSSFRSPIRHASVKVVGDNLFVFFTKIGDRPEAVYVSKVVLNNDWKTWKTASTYLVVEPEKDYEGGHMPFTVSKPGTASKPIRELRDPFIFEENYKWYVLYTVAGEHGIAIGEIHMIDEKILPGTK